MSVLLLLFRQVKPALWKVPLGATFLLASLWTFSQTYASEEARVL